MEKLPGGPVIRTLWFHCRGPGLITVWRTKILQAAQHSQKQTKNPQNKKPHQTGFILYFQMCLLCFCFGGGGEEQSLSIEKEKSGVAFLRGLFNAVHCSVFSS